MKYEFEINQKKYQVEFQYYEVKDLLQVYESMMEFDNVVKINLSRITRSYLKSERPKLIDVQYMVEKILQETADMFYLISIEECRVKEIE
jgi:hypothetical protein